MNLYQIRVHVFWPDIPEFYPSHFTLKRTYPNDEGVWKWADHYVEEYVHCKYCGTPQIEIMKIERLVGFDVPRPKEGT